ncbi:melanoma inhibitory activity protein 2-like [Sciurus carolinensis]|uniref:melanoma inhibitory activity protein 2-like n=1 Tax=Sciurus carolinensis TaxID=30640 RepID=UPI001FB4614A|nr:melanoma inhibitory activity protein 2-like [Sciurus carolinensis]
MEGPKAAPQSYWDLGLEKIFRVVPALPEDGRPGPNPDTFRPELVICAAIGFFTVFLFLWRSVQSVRSRLYVRREKKLALELSELIEKKCNLLDKVSLLQKEHEGLQSSFKDANPEKASKEVQYLEIILEMLNRSKSKLEDETLSLETKLKEEKSKRSEQDELMGDISKRIKSLEDESTSIITQVTEDKTTLRLVQMNEEDLKEAIKETLNENYQLQESQKHLLREAEVWKEKVSDLRKQKITLKNSKIQAEQVLSDKESHIKSLTERLLKIKDQSPVPGEDLTGDGNLEMERKSELEIGAHLGNQPKEALKELLYAAELNASLDTLEGERRQMYTLLSEVDKTKEDLRERIKNLQNEQESLQSENTQFENKNQKLQEKFKLKMEEHQENTLKLHRKLIVEKKCRLEEEERFSEVERKINHAAKELETYRNRAKDLDEELDTIVHYYERRSIFYEKKAQDNALAAWRAEKNLNYFKTVNANKRQKLTDMELQFKLLEDPYAPNVFNTAFARGQSPYGPSPLSGPSSEMRAFPFKKKGPPRLSPLYPGKGGRGSGGPEDPLDHHINNERGEASSGIVSDPHRAPAGTGPLSSPWELEHKMMIPPQGRPHSDPTWIQRQHGYYYYGRRQHGYYYYGRPSEPGEPPPVQFKNVCSLRRFPHPPPRAGFFPPTPTF